MKPSSAGLDDVAIVIVNHNTPEELAACLGSLASGGLDGVTAAVWVVDNASRDDAARQIVEEFPGVTLLVNDANVGYAAANNRALEEAGFGTSAARRFRHALLLNPDTVVPPGSIRDLVECLEKEPDVGVVGPKLVLSDGSLDLACRRSFPTPEVSFYRFSGLGRLFPRSRRFGRYNLTYLDPDEPADVDSVVGACMLIRGEAIDRVGLLDERFWMYGEDLDWSLRISRAGWRVVYRPHIVIHHIKRAASSGSSRAHYEFQRAMWLFYDKHYRQSTPFAVHWLVVLALALRGGRRLLSEMLRGRAPAPVGAES